MASRTVFGTVPPKVSQGALAKQNPGSTGPWGNPVVAFLLFLHSSCFDNEMIVWILQEVIISTGTEPVLVQRLCLARAKTSEVTAEFPILENLRQTSRPPGNLLFAGWLILKDKPRHAGVGWETVCVGDSFHSGWRTKHLRVPSFVCKHLSERKGALGREAVTAQKRSSVGAPGWLWCLSI